MAVADHVRLVRSGLEAIAAWRRRYGPLDLSGANLSGAHLIGAHLSNADLRGADLRRADLREADLVMADLREANLSRANLRDADLRQADLGRANLRDADLGIVNLGGANLSRANLRGAHLGGADLGGANLSGANLGRSHEALSRRADLRQVQTWSEEFGRINFSQANLSEADLDGANLMGADLREADLVMADLSEADLSGASLWRADLSGASLRYANLSGADLGGANLSGANLQGAVLNDTNLSGAMLRDSRSGQTSYANIDLSATQGLEEVAHAWPSSIAIDTLRLSAGAIPETFLRGCGLADWEITLAKVHVPGLTPEQVTLLLYRATEQRAGAAIQVSPIFISYAQADRAFVDALEPKLNAKGIRFWRDIHDMTSGRLDKQISRGIALNPTLLLVLSEHSVKSDWVEYEAGEARKLEKELGRDVLCPIALDEAWKTCDWSGPLRRQIEKYNILPFADWRRDTVLAAQFEKLLKGMQLFYRGTDGKSPSP